MRRAGALALVFAAVAVLAGVDIATDLGRGSTFAHVALEGAAMLAALAGAGIAARQMTRLRRDARDAAALADALGSQLEASREEASRWRTEAAELITGLSAAIDRQLARWQLTDAESAVALLLLKGLSHKEIAAVRGVGETTVRQQARALYKKAGLAGRHELAAFFLEDLLDRSDATS